jgi:phosphoribosylformylglycinamidine synthase
MQATLAFNAAGRFECRWVTLLPTSQRCLWTRHLNEPVRCPVAHGEGNFTLADPAQLAALQNSEQVALVYAAGDEPAGGRYPENPNGSTADIAGICNPEGNVLGLMPHPENHIYSYQNPNRTAGLGLRLFQNGVRYASQR